LCSSEADDECNKYVIWLFEALELRLFPLQVRKLRSLIVDIVDANDGKWSACMLFLLY